MFAFEFFDPRVDFGDGRVIASAQPFDVSGLVEGVGTSLADTPHDCLDR